MGLLYCEGVSLELGLCFFLYFQQQVPLPLPCYDFTKVINSTVVYLDIVALFKTKKLAALDSRHASGLIDSLGVTGCEYREQVQFHRGMLIHDY